MEICIFHKWKFWQYLSEYKENQYEISILSISKMKIWTPLLIHKVESVWVSQTYIKTKNLLHEMCNVLYLLYHHLGANFLSRMLDSSISYLRSEGDFPIRRYNLYISYERLAIQLQKHLCSLFACFPVPWTVVCVNMRVFCLILFVCLFSVWMCVLPQMMKWWR